MGLQQTQEVDTLLATETSSLTTSNHPMHYYFVVFLRIFFEYVVDPKVGIKLYALWVGPS